MDYSEIVLAELQEAASLLNKVLEDKALQDNIVAAAELMVSSLRKEGKLIACGNGGSHCDAMHFAEELSGKYREERKPLAALAIAEPAYLTCTGNDYGYAQIFSRYVEGLGRRGDVLFAISTSGNSENVNLAAEKAQSMGMKVVALNGKHGGKLAQHCDVEIRVPHHGYADRTQEIHIKIIHTLILLIEKML